MRHAPFVIGPAERDAWLRHMADAVLSLNLPAEFEQPLWDYLSGAAYAMQNAAESPSS
jgi:hemoglobin